jgi:thioredoxin 1
MAKNFPFLVYMQFTPQPSTRTPPKIVLESEEFSRSQFEEALQQNPGRIVIKFGATWCGPCKQIEPLVSQWFSKMPETVKCFVVDIDESFDLYSAIRSKRQINGVPAILCFNKGNVSYIPDLSVVGANVEQVNLFFKQVCQM